MRLIDADKFMTIIKQNNYLLSDRIGSIDYGMFTTGIQQAIDECETIDAAPVVHGKWDVGYFRDRVCNKCLHPSNSIDQKAWKYCPHCGAKMDADDVSNE